MQTLTTRTRIAELAAGPPALLDTLAATGLYRPGDDADLTLGQLCWNYGFNPGILLMILQSANQPPAETPPVDTGRFQAMSLDQLVAHIVATHHEGLRQRLPRLAAVADLAAAGSAAGEFALRLRDEVHALTLELEAHLAHEEEALFPMVRDLAGGSLVRPTRCGGAVGGPIACMENEHADTFRTLGRLAGLVERCASPAQDDQAWRELCSGLRWLDRDLREHIYKEDHILFPRALAAQRGVRVSGQGPAVPLS
jgi:regulator of cell morphogenesis and NO signaling